MSTDFPKFAAHVSQNVSAMLTKMLPNEEPFFVNIEGDALWEHYLGSFPEGGDPFFRKATEHTCSCCRNFIKNVGAMVMLDKGEAITVWDNGDRLPWPYNIVANAMEERIKSLFIGGIYRTAQAKYGAPFTVEMIEGKAHRWHHFDVTIPPKLVTKDAASIQAEAASSVQVLRRGLEELTQDSLDTISELIEEKSLYRGAEQKSAVENFKHIFTHYHRINDPLVKDRYVWRHHRHHSARFRNTAVGTLAVDLSGGMDTEKAAEAFGRKLDPVNYKRPKSIITKKMIDEASKTLTELGLEGAIHRRHATLADIKVNNVLWVDAEARNVMEGRSALHDLLQGSRSVKQDKVPNFEKSQVVTIEEFLDLLPEISSMELLLSNDLVPNLVSLTAPSDGDTGKLFKWDNDFAWSYNGELADSSIAQRVTKAGGKVQGAKLRVSLAWFNRDDLDLHIFSPREGHICFSNRMGILDVDMNVSNPVRDAVENCSWTAVPKDGVYQVVVNQYTQRENQDFGFDIEIESGGKVIQYSYRKPVVGTDGRVGYMSRGLPVMDITIKGGVVDSIKPHLEMAVGGSMGQEVWGLDTNTMVKVNTVMHSPNFWDENEVGNRHTFFILEGMKNPEPIRGFYNEFLRGDLTKHRKVFEVLGSKTKIEPSEEQLSGVGVSSTKDQSVSLLIELGGRKRPVQVMFG